ncbi:MAG: hypothetical protein IRZ08_23035, partial [Frankia sp.]|nr:hypothetical protein [Frankia sp.]
MTIERRSRFQPLTAQTASNGRPDQARWAFAMKTAMNERRISLPELHRRVGAMLGISQDKLARWLSNYTTVDPHAIAPLAEAIAADPVAMLAEFGITQPSVADLTRRLRVAEDRVQALQDVLARRGGPAGGFLFAADPATEDGSWSVQVVPHSRGRRVRYRFADYVLIERVDGMTEPHQIEKTFEASFKATAASWEEPRFFVRELAKVLGEKAAAERPRLMVHRFSERRERSATPAVLHLPAAGPHGTGARELTGIVVTGLQWSGSYTIAALLCRALGWGLGSFARDARLVRDGVELDTRLADQIMAEALGQPARDPMKVWAHVLIDPPVPDSPSARLLRDASPGVAVVVAVPDDEMAEVMAKITGSEPDNVRALSSAWAELLPPGPARWHVPVHAPRL